MAVTPGAMSIRVFIDTICPFCYIGYRKLDRALALVQKDRDFDPVLVRLKFEPFQLDPTMPKDRGVTRRERLKAKFGDDAERAVDRVQTAGKAVGIEMTSDAIVRNTTDSHRILEYAFAKGGEGAQRRVLESIYAGHFERGEDIGDHDFLASSAVQAGLFSDVAAGKAWLRGDEEVEAVEAACRKAQTIGITGVPFLIIDGKYAISGAQEPETIHKMLKRVVLEKSAEAGDPGRDRALPA